jgi:hypothetical protein
LSWTDNRVKTFTDWKVRAIPILAIRWGFARVTSVPLKRIFPLSGMTAPERRLKSVVFPAPFGPIRPRISLYLTSIVTPEIAARPPKRL